MYYLAYGSNLNKQQMKHRCPDAVPVGKTELVDMQLVFRRGFLTIEPKEGSRVPVGIWRISKADEAALDRYEGYPKFYGKEEVRAQFDGAAYHGDIPCIVYIMNEGHPIQRPTKLYFQTVEEGYKDFGMDLAPLLVADLDAYYNTNQKRRNE